MKKSALILLIITSTLSSTVLLLAQNAEEVADQHTKIFEESSLMSVHVFNLTSKEEEEELLTIFSAFNNLFRELGYPTVRYRLWKISGKQLGEHAYRWDSIFPTHTIHDKVHANQKFKNLVDEHRSFFEKNPIKDLHNQYTEVLVDAKTR